MSVPELNARSWCAMRCRDFQDGASSEAVTSNKAAQGVGVVELCGRRQTKEQLRRLRSCVTARLRDRKQPGQPGGC